MTCHPHKKIVSYKHVIVHTFLRNLSHINMFEQRYGHKQNYIIFNTYFTVSLGEKCLLTHTQTKVLYIIKA